MNRRIFTIVKPTKINIIKSRLAIKCLCVEPEMEICNWK